MLTNEKRLEIMKAIWEGKGKRWKDLDEYPYTADDKRTIMNNLSATADRIARILQSK